MNKLGFTVKKTRSRNTTRVNSKAVAPVSRRKGKDKSKDSADLDDGSLEFDNLSHNHRGKILREGSLELGIGRRSVSTMIKHENHMNKKQTIQSLNVGSGLVEAQDKTSESILRVGSVNNNRSVQNSLFSKKGVSVQFLKNILEQFDDETTLQQIRESQKLQYFESLQHDNDQRDDTLTYVSCSNDIRLSELINLIEKNEVGAFWIEVFCLNYELDDQISEISKMKSMLEFISSNFCRELCFVVEMSNKLNFWILWQIYCATRNSVSISILLANKNLMEIKSSLKSKSLDLKILMTPIVDIRIKPDNDSTELLELVESEFQINENVLLWACSDALKRSLLNLVSDTLLVYKSEFGTMQEIKIRQQIASIYKKELRDIASGEFHLRNAFDLVKDKKAARSEEKVSVLIDLGLCLKETGQFVEAEELYSELLEAMDTVIGRRQLATTSVMVSLGEVQRERGKFAEAQDNFLEALDIRREHRLTKLRSTFGVETSNPIIEESIQMVEDDSPGIVECLLCLAECCKLEGDFEMGKNYCEQVININKKLNAPAQMVKAYIVYAYILEALEHYDEAEEYLRKALEIRRNGYGEKHPSVASSYIQLALFLKNRNRNQESRELYELALSILTALYGAKSRHLNVTKGQIALLLQSEAKFGEAETLLKEVIAVEKSFPEGKGRNLVVISGYVNNLANLYKEMDQLDKAEDQLRESLEYIKLAMGDVHPKVGLALWNLAVLQKLKKNVGEAKRTWEQALDVYTQSLGYENPQVRRCHEWWANSELTS